MTTCRVFGLAYGVTLSPEQCDQLPWAHFHLDRDIVKPSFSEWVAAQRGYTRPKYHRSKELNLRQREAYDLASAGYDVRVKYSVKRCPIIFNYILEDDVDSAALILNLGFEFYEVPQELRVMDDSIFENPSKILRRKKLFTASQLRRAEAFCELHGLPFTGHDWIIQGVTHGEVGENADKAKQFAYPPR